MPPSPRVPPSPPPHAVRPVALATCIQLSVIRATEYRTVGSTPRGTGRTSWVVRSPREIPRSPRDTQFFPRATHCILLQSRCQMSALECPVCLEPYDDTEHEPKILPCSGSHELCGACLRLLRQDKKRNFQCPECRQKIDRSARINTNRGLLAALQAGPTVASSGAAKAESTACVSKAESTPNSSDAMATGGSLCSACERRLPRDAFSRVQLGKSAASRRCKTCISAAERLPSDAERLSSQATAQVARQQRSPGSDVQPKVFSVSVWCAEAVASAPGAVRREMGSETPLKVLRKVEAGGRGNFDKMRQDPYCMYPELASVCLTCGAAPPSGEAWPKCSRCGIASYCCASHQKLGWTERGHKETCGWYLPCKAEVIALSELSIPSVVRILVQFGPASADVALHSMKAVHDICDFDESGRLGPQQRAAYSAFASQRGFGPALVHIMNAFTTHSAIQASGCHLIASLGLCELLPCVTQAGAIAAVVQSLRLAQQLDWKDTSDEGDCPLPTLAMRALMECCNDRCAGADAGGALARGAENLCVAAISRAALRRSSDDEELAGLAIAPLLLMAQEGTAELDGVDSRADSSQLRPLPLRSLVGFHAVRDAGGVEAVVAAMRAFPALHKPGGEFLSNMLSIDPMGEEELLARYERGDKCIPSDINAAAGSDVEKIMRALSDTESLPDYVPPSSRPQARDNDPSGAPTPPRTSTAAAPPTQERSRRAARRTTGSPPSPSSPPPVPPPIFDFSATVSPPPPPAPPPTSEQSFRFHIGSAPAVRDTASCKLATRTLIDDSSAVFTFSAPSASAISSTRTSPEPRSAPSVPPSALPTNAHEAFAAAEVLRVGAVVRIEGLDGCTELNGHRGVVVAPITANGRWAVHVLALGTQVALRPERLRVDAPCTPPPSERELTADLELVSLVTLLADHGPRCIRFCAEVCGALFRRALNGRYASSESASLARLPIAAVLTMCLETHAVEIKRQVRDGQPGQCLTSISMLISKLPPQAACETGLPVALCARLHDYIELLEEESEEASGGDEPGPEYESSLALSLSTIAIPALYSLVIGEDGNAYPGGAQAICAAGGAEIVVRFLEAASDGFADTLPTSLCRLADMSLRRVTSLISSTVKRAFGSRNDGSGGDGDPSSQETMMLSLVFAQLRASLKLLAALADSGPGADAVLASGAFDASAAIVDWYPEERILVGLWKDVLCSLGEHRPKRYSKLLTQLCSDGLKGDDESLHRPTAHLIIQHMVEHHGDELRECLQNS